MLIKVFGGIDIVLGGILIFINNINFSTKVTLVFAMVLFLKAALGMLKDVGSWIDLFAGGIFIASIAFTIPGFLGLTAGILLIQKGVFSFVPL